ncbi:Hypothetical predicted protein [Cloeon dipterum]|uniref:Uncharacterized protein n=1 Tax=Cloeon dipterum TaxID=197152 RepID=A0A8S1CXP8_9INSE|nr:Hypothetical predicted protein [Cloeon dipterum]
MGATEEKNDEASVPLSSEEPAKKEASSRTKCRVVGVLGSFMWLSLCGDAPLITEKMDHAVDESKTRARRAFSYLLHFLDITGRNFGQICFANNPISGFLILAGLAVGNLTVAICGLIASTVGILFSLLMKQPCGSIRAGLCCYNAALFGAVLPALLLGPSPVAEEVEVYIAVLIGSVFTVMITVSVANSLSSLKPAIPLFTLPFNLVALFAILVLRVHQPLQLPARVPAPEFDWTHVRIYFFQLVLELAHHLIVLSFILSAKKTNYVYNKYLRMCVSFVLLLDAQRFFGGGSTSSGAGADTATHLTQVTNRLFKISHRMS